MNERDKTPHQAKALEAGREPCRLPSPGEWLWSLCVTVTERTVGAAFVAKVPLGG